MARGVWVDAGARAGNMPSPHEKASITASCEPFIATLLVPQFLPQIRPSTTSNYPIAIQGKWHGNKYRFFTRFRTYVPRATVAEFDDPFARLDFVVTDRFDLLWHRHTGAWHCVGQRLTLAHALEKIGSEPYFVPC